jgi:hypothetical protein
MQTADWPRMKEMRRSKMFLKSKKAIRRKTSAGEYLKCGLLENSLALLKSGCQNKKKELKEACSMRKLLRYIPKTRKSFL